MPFTVDTEGFADLLQKYLGLVQSDNLRSPNWELVKTYLQLADRDNRREAQVASTELALFTKLLGESENSWQRHWDHEINCASDFNVLDVFGLRTNEVRHSMAIAWLFDADPGRPGSHSQRNLGWRLFLKAAGLPLNYADSKYRVSREVRGAESIIDVEIAQRGHFLVHIENKIGAGLGSRQLEREWEDIQTRATGLGVAKANVHAIVLKLDSMAVCHPHFAVMTWRQMAMVFDDFAENAKPDQVRTFARHFAGCIRTLLPTTGIHDAEATVE